MDYYQQQFQNCSFLSIADGNVYDLPTCLKAGHVFYESTPEELEDEQGVRKVDSENGVCDSTSKLPLMGLNATKAGMSGVNIDQINKKIMQISVGSKFHEHKLKQQEKVNRKINEMKEKLYTFSNEQIYKAQIEVDNLVRKIEADMDLSRYYVHLDMDAFYASVEMRDDPSLRDVPMAVGTSSMLSTSNYLARTYGVRAAMPGFIAKRLCPGLKIIPNNFHKYKEASRIVEETIKVYDHSMFMCMDEADLDITDLVIATVGNGTTPEDKRMRDSCAYNIVKEMRAKIEAMTQLTASAGIAPTRYLAKLCSDMRKPNGQLMLANRKPAIMAFLSMIPVRKACGVGAVTEQLLKGLDIENCKMLWEQRAILSLIFKRASFQNLLGISIGTGSSVFRDLSDNASNRRSLSCERTFTGTADLGFLQNLCKSLCAEIEKDLKKAGLSTKTITLKIKTTEYDVKTRARSIMERTDSAERIFQAAWRIYMSYVAEFPELTIRLMGVRASNLEDKRSKESNSGSLMAQRTLHQFLKNKDPPKRDVPSVVVSSSSYSNESLSATPAVPVGNSQPKCFMKCPVCSKDFSSDTIYGAEALLDRHIDDCLSKGKIMELKTQPAAPVPTLPNAKKRAGNSIVGNSTKKVKRAPNKLPAPAATLKLDSYFSKA